MFLFEKFSKDKEKEWDEFVENTSINGTFLHSRNFLNYHPKERFQDASIMIYDEKGKLSAIIPACEFYENDHKIFFSHKGSTFGGVVLDKKKYKAQYILPLIEELLHYLKQEGYAEGYLKNTSDLFSLENMDLFEYAYYYYGFQEYKELNTYIDYQCYKENIISNFAHGKRQRIAQCERRGMIVRELYDKQEIEKFYDILCDNLEKYHIKPVHTLEELLDFKNNRLKKECGFFGCFLDDEMIAGAMMFYFFRCKTAHTQYLSTKNAYVSLNAMSYLYYNMIKEMKERGFKKISFGIATENRGRYINLGLLYNKENYGSAYNNNCTYHINLLALEEQVK